VPFCLLLVLILSVSVVLDRKSIATIFFPSLGWPISTLDLPEVTSSETRSKLIPSYSVFMESDIFLTVSDILISWKWKKYFATIYFQNKETKYYQLSSSRPYLWIIDLLMLFIMCNTLTLKKKILSFNVFRCSLMFCSDFKNVVDWNS
jgi:hypothetical protein